MEFNEKLQELRKQKGLTQEELASSLYVSRTAISKWESGRGYPNIESLKTIAKFFSVTVDELLSTDEVLTIAEEDNKRKEKHFRDLMYGLLDICIGMLFFLPFYPHSKIRYEQNKFRYENRFFRFANYFPFQIPIQKSEMKSSFVSPDL